MLVEDTVEMLMLAVAVEVEAELVVPELVVVVVEGADDVVVLVVVPEEDMAQLRVLELMRCCTGCTRPGLVVAELVPHVVLATALERAHERFLVADAELLNVQFALLAALGEDQRQNQVVRFGLHGDDKVVDETDAVQR